jgi:hypothetical protein
MDVGGLGTNSIAMDLGAEATAAAGIDVVSMVDGGICGLDDALNRAANGLGAGLLGNELANGIGSELGNGVGPISKPVTSVERIEELEARLPVEVETPAAEAVNTANKSGGQARENDEQAGSGSEQHPTMSTAGSVQQSVSYMVTPLPKRKTYTCTKCGKPKLGHKCTFNSRSKEDNQQKVWQQPRQARLVTGKRRCSIVNEHGGVDIVDQGETVESACPPHAPPAVHYGGFVRQVSRLQVQRVQSMFHNTMLVLVLALSHCRHHT